MTTSSELSMPVWDQKHLRAATRAAGVALWAWNVDTDAITMDEHAYELWEVSRAKAGLPSKYCRRISILPIWKGLDQLLLPPVQ